VSSRSGGIPITDYTVQYSSNGGSTWSVFSHSPSTATSVTVTGLTNGTSYVFRVAAVDSSGTGSWSGHSAAVVPRTVPALPTNVTAMPGNGRVSLIWTAATSDGGSVVTDYTLQYSSNGGSSWNTFPHSATTARAATVTGLANGTSYVFRVAAVNIAGTGTHSVATPRVTPLAAGVGVPTAVAGNGYVDLRWTAPSLVGMPPITDYAIRYSSNSGATWSLYPHTASAATSRRVVVANGSTYTFQVAPVVSGGVGGYSLSSSAVTPYSPSSRPVAPGGVVAKKVGAAIILSWNPATGSAGGPVTDYVVQYRLNTPNARWLTYRDLTSPANSANLSLRAGYSYVFRVAAKNLAGVGAFSAQSAPVRV